MATVFDISGPLALYRKPYTTTSTASFPVPPPTAVAGLLASIIGIGNGSEQESCSSQFWAQLQGTRIAIQRLNPPAWFSTTINFWNTKEPQKNPHIRVKHQFVKNPHYRIFVQDGVENALRAQLEAGRFYYTPTLGAAYTLADVNFLGSFDYPKARLTQIGEEIRVVSAVPITGEAETNIDFLKTRGVMKDAFPFRLDEKRTLLETIPLLYPSSPEHQIVLKVWEGLDVSRYGESCIVWLPAW
jgi:CRISPR-associated protein Cas5h